MKDIIRFGLIFLLVTSLTGNHVNSENFQLNQIEEIQNTSIMITKDMDINFIGFTEDRINLEVLNNSLPQIIDPFYDIELYQDNEINIDFKFKMNYSFNFLDIVDEYLVFIKSIAVEDKAPLHLNDEYENVSYIDTFQIQQFLEDHKTKPSLFVIDTYTSDMQSYTPYIYNGSVGDHDTGRDGNREYAQNEITGGGGDVDFLWIDLSAGPIGLFFGTPFEIGENEIPPIWNYGDSNIERDRLSGDIGGYLQSGIHFNIVPHFIQIPLAETKPVEIQIVIMDIDEELDGYDQYFDINHIKDELSQTNSYLNWSSQINYYNTTDDTSFMEFFETLQYGDNGILNSSMMREYILSNYYNLFSITDDRTYLPLIIFALPDNMLFDNYNGFAFAETTGDFHYAQAVINNNVVNIPQQTAFLHYNETFSLANGEMFEYNRTIGQTDVILQTRITSNNSIDLTLFDHYQKLNSDPDIDYIEKRSGTDILFNMTLDIAQQLFWKIEASSDTNTTIELTGFYDFEYGITNLILHELGHGVGLPHTHEGLVFNEFGGPNHIQSYIWGSVLSTMAYYNDYTHFSKMNSITIQRGWTIMELETLLDNKIPAINDLIQTRGSQLEGTDFEIQLDELNSTIHQLISSHFNDTLQGYDHMIPVILELHQVVDELSVDVELYSPSAITELPRNLEIGNNVIIAVIVTIQVIIVSLGLFRIAKKVKK